MYVHFTQESCAKDYLRTNRGQRRSPIPMHHSHTRCGTLCLEGRTRIWLWARCKCRIPDIIYDVYSLQIVQGITFWEDHILYSSSTYWGCVVTVITWPVQMKFWLLIIFTTEMEFTRPWLLVAYMLWVMCWSGQNANGQSMLSKM